MLRAVLVAAVGRSLPLGLEFRLYPSKKLVLCPRFDGTGIVGAFSSGLPTIKKAFEIRKWSNTRHIL